MDKILIEILAIFGVTGLLLLFSWLAGRLLDWWLNGPRE